MKNRHILFIDPIEKLNYKKDSSLMLSLALKKKGFETFLLFEKDFHVTNCNRSQVTVYGLSGELNKDFYIDKFILEKKHMITWQSGDILHMRIDPPFDNRYLQYLWMLTNLEKKKVRVLNSVLGILYFNEKLAFLNNSLPSFISSSVDGFLIWAEKMRGSCSFLIAKPLNLFQGIGVEKWPLDKNIKEKFIQKSKKDGPIIVQRFFEGVHKGEIRSIFFKKKEIGSILKIPKKGDFLANIVKGANFSPYSLSKKQLNLCKNICKELSGFGIDLVAFDLLGDYISEVNITCPGLLVEVSFALKENMAEKIVDALN